MPQGEEKKELEATENFPKLMSDTKPHMQEAQKNVKED